MGRLLIYGLLIIVQLPVMLQGCGNAGPRVPVPDDIPALISRAGVDDGEPDFNVIDTLNNGLHNPELVDAIDLYLEESDIAQQAELTKILGWMGFRLIGENPDGEFVPKIAGRIERLVDTGEFPVQDAAVESVRLILSSEIDFPESGAASLDNVSPHNGYFAICMRALVGGLNSEYQPPRTAASGILRDIGYQYSSGLADYDKYTFMTSVGDREKAETLISSLPLSTEQFIEFYLDLAEYVGTLSEYPYGWGGRATFYSFDRTFHNSTVEEIIPFLDHESSIVRNAAIAGLEFIGEEALPAVRDAYENGNARRRLELLDLYNPDATNEDRFALLDEIIADDRLTVSQADINLFAQWYDGEFPEDPDDYPFDVIAFYLKLLESESVNDRSRAIGAFGQFAPGSIEVIPALIRIVSEPDVETNPYTTQNVARRVVLTLHSSTAHVLGEFGPAASDAIGYLVGFLNDESGIRRYNAAGSLYLIGHEPERMADYLVNALETEENPTILYLLEQQLIRVGPAASAAIPKLIELTEHQDQMVNYFARDAIAAVDGNYDRVLQMMIDYMNSDDVSRRHIGVSEILNFGRETDIAVALPVLLDGLNDETEAVRHVSCMALAEYGGYEEVIIPVVIDLMDLYSEQGAYIVRILETVGRPWADDAEDAVFRMIRSDNYNNISSAITVYLDIWGPTDQFIDLLVEVGGDTDYAGSLRALQALMGLGPEAARALPGLRALLNHENDNTRNYAQQAIDAIEGTETPPDL